MMNHYQKTIGFTIILCLVTISVVCYVQLRGEDSITLKCSYLDPVIVDYLAIGVALFLIIEGTVRIMEHKTFSLQKQFTRSIRIAMGCAIFTLHIIQFMHK